MPLVDPYIDPALDALVSALPSSGHWRLYASDPTLATNPSDVELDTASGGYTPPVFTPSAFSAASGDAKSTPGAISFGTTTGAYSDTALFWGITGSTVDDLAYFDFLDEPIVVDAAGDPANFTPTLSFADGA